MAQKSLAQLNRLGASSIWENAWVNLKYKWFGIKIIFFFNFFFKYYFNYFNWNYKSLWLWNNSFNYINLRIFNKKLLKKKKYKVVNSLFKHKTFKTLIFFTSYIFEYHNKLILLILFNNLNPSYLFSLIAFVTKTAKPIKKKSKQKIKFFYFF